MIHQLRIYEIFERNKAAFHARFRDHAARIMTERYGFAFLGMWETQSAGRVEFAYILVWPDIETKTETWARFMADEEWKEIKRVTREAHGEFVGAIEDRIMTLTDYSPRFSG